MGSEEFLHQMVEVLVIIMIDVLKEDFVKWKLNHRKDRMCPYFNYLVKEE